MSPFRVGLVVCLAERDNHGAHGSKNAIELCDGKGETLAYVIKPEHVRMFASAPDLLQQRDELLAALRRQVAWRKSNSKNTAESFGDAYIQEYLLNGAIGVTRLLEQESIAAIRRATEGQ